MKLNLNDPRDRGSLVLVLLYLGLVVFIIIAVIVLIQIKRHGLQIRF